MKENMYHFIGLGGIGMSALARILMQQGKEVQGTDAKASALLDQLGKEGAKVKVGHDAAWIQKGATVVFSSDISEKNGEIEKAKELCLPLLHRSELLDRLMEGKKALLVTGTHGKTTTASLLSWVLVDAGVDPTFAIGGILSKLDTNGKAGKGPFFVAEADESDGSFLKSPSFGAIVTNLDNDHMEYWKSAENLDAAFQKFLGGVRSREHLFWCKDDERLRNLKPEGFSYGFSQDADLKILSFAQDEKGIRFDLVFQGKKYRNIELPLFGRHNALNAAAVFGLSLQLLVPEEAIRIAFRSFSGTKRRLEFQGAAHKVKIYDDYGHHPVEITATLSALRASVRERRLVVIFQPHRYTRVRDLFESFLTCFSEADAVLLTDIYSAGEAPIPGVTTAALYSRMKESLGPKLHFFPRQHLEAGVVEILRPLDVALTIGAGDVTLAGPEILKLWAAKAPKIRVALVCGGPSAEHEVSINSAKTIFNALDPSVYDVRCFGVTKQGNWIMGPDSFDKLKGAPEDASSLGNKGANFQSGEAKMPIAVIEELAKSEVCIPVFHGPQGEDGMTQGFFDTLHIPYAGCDYRSGALCMHKGWSKYAALMNKVPTPPFFEMDLKEYRENPEALLEKIDERLFYPVWIKPVHLGSSIGVGCAKSPSEVKSLAEAAFFYDDTIIVELHVEGRQIEFGVIGNEFVRVGPPCEILNQGAFVDYAGKYGPSAMPYAIPARISETEKEIGIELAKKIYVSFGCKGLARVDFFIDNDGYFWFNEINPFPGCTATSAFPKIWAAAGVDMAEVSDDLVALALHRTRRNAEIGQARK
jgi:D-alanine-D-alanine ligase/UDP-N-acetylmuramate--alanine ligase